MPLGLAAASHSVPSGVDVSYHGRLGEAGDDDSEDDNSDDDLADERSGTLPARCTPTHHTFPSGQIGGGVK
jgi:hypothetical protein